MTRFRVLLAVASFAVSAASGELPQATRERLASENAALQAEIARVQQENADFRRQIAASSTLLTGENATTPGANATAPAPPASVADSFSDDFADVTAHETHVEHHHYDTVLGVIGGKVAGFVRDSSYQSVIAIVVVFVGLLSILDAVVFTRCVSVGIAAVAVGMLANSEAEAAWHGVLGDMELWIVGIEAGAITAAAAYVGFAGFQLVAGACLALGSAHLAARWAMIYAWQPESVFFFFALSAVLGVAGMRIGDKMACAVLGPATGGLMVASGVLYLIYDFTNITGDASPPWVDFADALLSGGGASNVFGGGTEFTIARSIGCAIWILVAFLGFSRYFFEWPKLGFFDDSRESSERVQHIPMSTGYKEPLVPASMVAPVPASIKYNNYAPRPGSSSGGPPGPPPPFRGGRRG